jgi:hypothetical protein
VKVIKKLRGPNLFRNTNQIFCFKTFIINNQIIRILTKFEMNLIIIYISLLYFILVANILKVIDEAIVTQISIFGLIPSTLSILLTYKPSRSLLLDWIVKLSNFYLCLSRIYIFTFKLVRSFTPVAPTGNKQNGPNFAQIFFGPVPRSERKIFSKGLF